MEDAKGVYTVKSCYKALAANSQLAVIPFWTKAWKFMLPPKIKTFFWQLCSDSLPTHDRLRSRHINVPDHCQIYYHSPTTFLEWLEHIFTTKTNNAVCKIITICWKIWDARNEKIWNSTILPAPFICHYALNFLFEWSSVHTTANPIDRLHAATTWSKPPHGLLKLNTDAAIDQSNHNMGFGFVLRNSEGCFIAACRLPWNGVYRPDEAEAISIREALKWTKSLQFDNIQVESDCQLVVNGILHDFDLASSLQLIFDDIRKIASSYVNLSFLFAKRSANRVAIA
ncbi:uncharacterized protein LOC116006813 [Ipomoea triloba]|uniref:uncharacterized protein LOC116006813 n=1 Tax=Ipomoea triloba TaxID=35885 RepID=UPI00125DFE4C|nr:uncharacterized protein LOC116006813 [Ipomoea triloba]